MTQESSVPTGFQVVEGGSDDPFVERDEDNLTTEELEAGSQPGDDEEGASEDEVTLTDEELASLDEELREMGWLPEEEVQKRISQVQSGWDSRNAALERQLREEREARAQEAAELRRQIHEARIEGLPEEERERARALFESEEERRRQAEIAQANDEYFRTVRAYDLSVRFGQYWPGDDDAAKRAACEAELLACDDVEQMTALALERKAQYYESIAAGAGPDAGKKGKAPAGAAASTDAGGSPPPPKESKPLTGQTLDDMAANIKGMFGKPGSFA